MTELGWHPGIDAVCLYWNDATMLQQTYQALTNSFEQENDACIDCAKSLIEVVAQIIIDELDTTTIAAKPKQADPTLSQWVGAAIRVLRLGDIRHRHFANLVKAHNELAEALRVLRNDAGPVSHGKEGFIERLTSHHRRAAVLSADAIVSFLHQAYLEAEPNLQKTREPYERFEVLNRLIDNNVSLNAAVSDDGDLDVTVYLPGGETIPITVIPSRFLFQIDRDAYIEALNAARSALATIKQGEEAAS